MASKTVKKEIPEQQQYFTPFQFNLIKALKKLGPLTRRDLVRELKTPRTTIHDNIVKLQRRNLVEKFSKNNGKRGRPLIFYKLTEGK